MLGERGKTKIVTLKSMLGIYSQTSFYSPFLLGFHSPLVVPIAQPQKHVSQLFTI